MRKNITLISLSAPLLWIFSLHTETTNTLGIIMTGCSTMFGALAGLYNDHFYYGGNKEKYFWTRKAGCWTGWFPPFFLLAHCLHKLL